MPNKDGRLLPGSFGEVHFQPGINAQKVTIPVNSMLFRQEGPRVAVVGSDGKVQLRPITIGRDYRHHAGDSGRREVSRTASSSILPIRWRRASR